MSHFSVMVVGPGHAEQLAPYHEFECTGTDDQYVEDVDITDEAREEYERAAERVYFNTETGEIRDAYADEFYRDPTEEEIEKAGPLGLIGSGGGAGLHWISQDWGDGKGYRAKVHYVPEGWVEERRGMKEMKSFARWAKEWYDFPVVSVLIPTEKKEVKYGYILIDAQGVVKKIVRRTNPRAKWDWWVVGGRWEGFFKLKDGWQADQVRKGDVDWEGMRAEARAKAAKEFDHFEWVTKGTPPALGWAEIRKKYTDDGEGIERARVEYNAQPMVKAMKEDQELWWDHVEDFACGREEYIARAGRRAIATYAVVKDGEWFEKGEMGWFGVGVNEKDPDAWAEEFGKMIDSLPDDTELTLVDCHI